MRDDRSGARRIVDWFFRDRTTGAIVIGQWPNAPLWVFLATSAVAWAAATFQAAPWLVTGLRILSLLALAWWALDEIVRGVNPWRRSLGGAALLYGLWSVAASV